MQRVFSVVPSRQCNAIFENNLDREEKTHREVIKIDDDEVDYLRHASSAVTHKTLSVYSPEKKFKIGEKKN